MGGPERCAGGVVMDILVDLTTPLELSVPDKIMIAIMVLLFAAVVYFTVKAIIIEENYEDGWR